jgi:hypothetical protein
VGYIKGKSAIPSGSSLWGDPGVVHSRDYDWSKLADSYQRSLLHPLAAHMCGGHALTYLIALRAFGNVARKIRLYQAVESTPDIAVSHAS